MKINSTTLEILSETKIQTILDLSQKIWLDTYPSIISIEQINYMLEKMYSRDVILNELKNEISWFLIKNENYIGFISFSFFESNNLKIFKFYILSEFQNKGVGKKVFRYIKELAEEKKLEKIFLNVNRFNKTAVQSYSKWGFKIKESVDIQYGKFILNDYIMEYNLKI